MGCSVKVIEDSLNPHNGIRLTTLQLRYWRAIHAEFMTHRVFSRNASSSRAQPVSKMIGQVWEDPAGPIHWGSNQSGMQAYTELQGFRKNFAEFMWGFSSKAACSIVWLINKVSNPHKQLLNRMLEPWQHISVIVTATEWDNFFDLRDHHAAQPEIQQLARCMKLEMEASTPQERRVHLPYVTSWEREKYTIVECLKLSTARCARVSYLTHEGKQPSYDKDMELYERLVGSVPIHASPTEHPALAVHTPDFKKNFRGWEQHRIQVEKNINQEK